MLEANDKRVFTDAHLLALLGHGEHRALSEIYDRYARLALSIALRTLSDRARADEIVQGVFTKVWRDARESLVERGKFSIRVRSTTHHECIDKLRRRRMRPVTEPCHEERLYKLASDHDPVQHTFEKARVPESLQQIPAAQRIVIELAFWGGLAQREIALHCRSPLGTVKTRFHPGMQRLKLLWQETERVDERIQKVIQVNNYCEIVVKGHLDMHWSGWYDGLTITHNDRGETVFSGWLRDQAAFHGLLAKMRDMGLFLISLKYQANKSLREKNDPDNDS